MSRCNCGIFLQFSFIWWEVLSLAKLYGIYKLLSITLLIQSYMGKFYIYTHRTELNFSKEISEKISYFLNTIVEILCRGSEGLTSVSRDAVHFGCSWKPSQSCIRVTVRVYKMCCCRAAHSLCWETCAPESWRAFKEIMGKVKRIRRWIEWWRYYCKWGNVLLTAMLITGDSEEMF